jgi:hypothetical protein
MPQVFVRPKAGLKVPFYPFVGVGGGRSPYIDPNGELMDESPYLSAREREGDVVLSASATSAAKNAIVAPAPAGKAEKAGA